MPDIIMDRVDGKLRSSHDIKEDCDQTPEGGGNTSIERLYENVHEMESSSNGSPSQQNFGSDGEESRIDSELHHLVGREMEAVEVLKEEGDYGKDVCITREGGSSNRIPKPKSKTLSRTKSLSPEIPMKVLLQRESDTFNKTSPKKKMIPEKGVHAERKPVSGVGIVKKEKINAVKEAKLQNGTEDPSEAGLDNPNLGPFLLKQARDLISSGDNPRKVLQYALRAAKSFQKCAGGKPSLDLVMCLHVIAAIHCSLKQYSEAIPVLEQSIEIPVLEQGSDHALAKFSGYMQLGDTYAMLGQLESSIHCYTLGLQVQKQALGDRDPRVGETYRYLAEAHVQALELDEAERLCKMALDIHREKGTPASPEETADRRLLGLICDTKGDYESALEHLVLASMAMMSSGQEAEVASVDCSLGETYLSLARYDEAVFAYQKALTVFKSTKGENHPLVASVFVRLADLYNKIGKFRESKSFCENALRVYGKPLPGSSPEEIASGLTDISAIYESMDEPEEALKLLKKALKIYDDAPGQQNTIAGIEAQMGVLYYISGNYAESYVSFKNAITKLRASGDKKSAFFGIALNQMGLACVQLYAINESADLFEEARSVLEQEYGPHHPDTLGVCSNLAGTYDAMGRLDKAIEILEHVVGIREEKLGTADPNFDDEKRRLAVLLREAGRVRHRKTRSLEMLLDTTNSQIVNKNSIVI